MISPFRYLHFFPTRRSSDLFEDPTRIMLAPRSQRSEPSRIFFGADGWTFRRPGVYRVRATLGGVSRSEEHTSELQSPCNLVCRLLLEKNRHHPIKKNDIF